MLVKICGLSNSVDARAAVESGATALGFVMGGSVLPYEVEPRAQDVREIVRTIPPEVETYLVTHLEDAGDILALAGYTRVSGIQISEPLEASELEKVRRSWRRKIIKTVVVDAQTGFRQLEIAALFADFALLDSRIGGYIGGTGVTSDWALCAELRSRAALPVYLAGGLTPENVEAGISAIGPDGVDVSTGVSAYSAAYPRKDRKDPGRIARFVESARRACHAL